MTSKIKRCIISIGWDRKQTGTEIHEYVLDGTNIVKEVVTDAACCPKYTNEYLYDIDGTVCGLKYNGTAYYFYKNLQGDVISIADDTGAVKATYTYDAWGVCEIESDTSGCNIATINPFRYRGYYYDTETDLYYLQSRYYDPEVGRFINADDCEILKFSISDFNYHLYSYCNNNPINQTDTSGKFSLKGIFKTISEFVLLSWSGVKIKLPYILSIIVGILCVIYKIYGVISEINGIQKITDNKFATAIVALLPYGTAYASAEIIAWLCNVGAVVAAMSMVLTFVMACCSGGIFNLAKTVINFLISYILPPVISAVQMIYYGFKYQKGCIYNFKLIGGVSITFE